MATIKAGLIGIVDELTRTDFWGTMERLAELGFRGIEGATPALTHGDVAANVERFNGLGLQILTLGASREALRDDLAKVINDASALKSKRVTVWWGPCDDRDALLRDAELYNAAGATLAREGIQLCYHNHGHEFRTTFNGVYALDVLAEHTDPAALA